MTIRTRVLAPTLSKGKRVVADTETGERLVNNWDYAANELSNHHLAAAMLATELYPNRVALTGVVWGEVYYWQCKEISE